MIALNWHFDLYENIYREGQILSIYLGYFPGEEKEETSDIHESPSSQPLSPVQNNPLLPLSTFQFARSTTNRRWPSKMALDHIFLPCPAFLVNSEATFLSAALGPLGISEDFRLGSDLVAFGTKKNGRFLWVTGRDRNQQRIEKEGAAGVHVAIRADGEVLFSWLFSLMWSFVSGWVARKA